MASLVPDLVQSSVAGARVFAVSPHVRGVLSWKLACGFGLGLLAASAAGSCILADPAPTLPVVQIDPPDIELGSVVPSAGFLTKWPDESTGFTIPVYVTDSSQPLVWLAYVDFDPAPGATNPTVLPVTVAPSDGSPVRLVHASIGEPLGSGCHTVEVVIAFALETGTDTPVYPPGGSVVTWTYTRSGDPGECAPYTYDASAGDGGA